MFNQDEDILVWDEVEAHAVPRKFVIFYSNLYWCQNPNDCMDLTPWHNAKAIPEQKRVMYDVDTFPKGLVFIRKAGAQRGAIVLACNEDSVRITGNKPGSLYYEYMDEIYEISTDNEETYQPASLLVEGGSDD